VKYAWHQAAEPFDIAGQDRIAEEFIRPCYGGRLGAGVRTQYGQAPAAPGGSPSRAGAGLEQQSNGQWR
jgi:monoamine oxidase